MKNYSARIINLVTLFFLSITVTNVFSQDTLNLDLAYRYLNEGQTRDAITIFESYVNENPSDSKICLQLGYSYLSIYDEDKAYYYFDYVIKNATNNDDIDKAKKQIFYIEENRKQQTKVILSSDTSNVYSSGSETDDLNMAYRYLREGKTNLAVPLFEKYAQANPKDTKVYMQLGYLYFDRKEYRKSLDKFEYVSEHSKDCEETEKARESIFVLRQMIPMYARTSYDLYFYNIYDTYQQNYISNFLSHINFKVMNNFYTGLYVDLYLDSRSKPGLIYNDRFFEIGGFWKFYFLRYFSFELRGGYVREIDLKKNGFNVKPILAFGMRVGNPKFYAGCSTRKREFMFLDIYSTILYDYKFKNIFGQVYLRETMRFLTGGYSYFDFYLAQNIMGDTKQYDYNNFGEVIAGIGYKPNMTMFPTFFIEATNKFYWKGVPKNSFQVKAGFLLTFSTVL